jgi:Ca2+-binding RTX toxin-like protein
MSCSPPAATYIARRERRERPASATPRRESTSPATPSDNTLQGNSQANVLNGSTGNDALYGNAGNDTLLGGAGSDFLRGDAGNDSIDGGVIADRINYTDGNTVSYANSTGAVNVNLSGITGTGSTGTGTASDGLGGTDTLANIFYVQGSSQDDTLVGSAALTLEVFEGRAGNDTINGGAITDTLNGENSNRVSYQNAAVAVNVNLATGTATSAADTGAGSDGNDTLININQVRGSSHADTLTGSDDLVLTEQFEGRAGADTIDGAGGLDLVRYDNAAAGVNVDLAGGTASDGYGTTDTLSNIEGARGSKFADTLSGGNAANDALEFFMGLEGNDTIDGGRGYDRAEYTLSTAGVNVTLGGAGSGTASDGYGTTDTLISIEGVRGSAFNDTLTGSNAADIFESFEGREGNDNINGMGGTDRVVYTASKAGVTVNLATGTASDGYGGTDSLNNIEDVLGSRDFNDSLTGSAADNKLEGQGRQRHARRRDRQRLASGAMPRQRQPARRGIGNGYPVRPAPGLDVADGGADADTLLVIANFADYTRSRPSATDTRLVNRRHRRRHHLPQRRIRHLPRRHPLAGRRPAQHRQRLQRCRSSAPPATTPSTAWPVPTRWSASPATTPTSSMSPATSSPRTTDCGQRQRPRQRRLHGRRYLHAHRQRRERRHRQRHGRRQRHRQRPRQHVLLGNATANLLNWPRMATTRSTATPASTPSSAALGNDSYTVDVPADVITELLRRGNRSGQCPVRLGRHLHPRRQRRECPDRQSPRSAVNLTGNGLGNNLAGERPGQPPRRPRRR